MRVGRLSAGLGTMLAAWLVAGPAAARNIRISMTPNAALRDGVLAVEVSVSNSGDEAAHAVTPGLSFRGQRVRGQPRDSLGPNESMAASLTVPAADLRAGRWPFRLSVDYTDANQYPFQALNVAAVALGSPPPAKVLVREITSRAVSTSGSGAIALTVKNLTPAPQTARVEVVVPEGLEVTATLPPISLAAWEEKSLQAPVANRAALAGSRLPVFATVEYDDGDVHQAVIAQGMVDVVAAQSFFAGQRLLLWIGAVILVSAWGGFLVARLVRRRPAGARARRS